MHFLAICVSALLALPLLYFLELKRRRCLSKRQPPASFCKSVFSRRGQGGRSVLPAQVVPRDERAFATGIRAPRLVERKRRKLVLASPFTKPAIQVGQKAHRFLQRILKRDTLDGPEAMKNCRLVNWHWYRELTRSVVELTPKLTVFTLWDIGTLRKFSNLQKLTLRDHCVSDYWLEELPKVTPQLQALAIRFVSPSSCNGPFSESGIRALMQLSRLTHLEVAGSDFKSLDGMRVLAKLQQLTYLDLSENGLSPHCLHPLTALSNLQSLILGGNQRLGDESVCVIRQFRQLRQISLRNCRPLTDYGIWRLCDMSALTSMDLRTCESISGIGFEQNSASIPLVRLDLMGCIAMTNANLRHLAIYKFLKYLDLRMCPLISDRGIVVLKALASLTDLRIGSGNMDITNAGLGTLAQLPCLESVVLFFVHGITNQGIEGLYMIETLRRLKIVQCCQIAPPFSRQPTDLTVHHYPCI